MSEWIKILLGILGGGIGVEIIKAIAGRFDWNRKRKAEKEDRDVLDADTEIRNIKKQVAAICDGMKFILYDRIRYLGHEYIADGYIDFDDRRILNSMHDSYHNGLGGNGDLDILMGEVNRLPLRKG